MAGDRSVLKLIKHRIGSRSTAGQRRPATAHADHVTIDKRGASAMAKSNATTDTKTSRRVTGKDSAEAEANTQAAGEPGASGEGSGAAETTGRSMDPDFKGLEGEMGGPLAHSEKDIQTGAQANAGPSDRTDPNEVHEYITTGAGRVQSTTPVNDPAR